jgi:hypothetical protein
MDELKFTLKEMENVYYEANNEYLIFKNSLEELDKIINQLGEIWKSEETETYETFIIQYKEKYFKLIETRDLMNLFCNILQEKKEEYISSSKETKNSFE